MKKLLIGILLLLTATDFAYASKVNLGKTGTPWVWRVENGSDSGFVMLMEDGTTIVTEAGARIIGESSAVANVLLENGDRLLFENGNEALLESSTAGEDTMLYRSLIGQGWEVTDSAANIPQGIAGTDAALAYDLLLLENGSRLLLENTNTLRLEN